MKISTKGRYALRLMTDLAIHKDDGYISIKTVSQRQGISENYLEQIIKLLAKENLVECIRGAQGGYRLTREPVEYTVGEILRVTEGSLAPVACLATDENTCENCMDCVTLEIWQCVHFKNSEDEAVALLDYCYLFFAYNDKTQTVRYIAEFGYKADPYHLQLEW